jgi:uncharacterized protein YjiS (DUF1127 family)
MTILTETHSFPHATGRVTRAAHRLLLSWRNWRKSRQTGPALHALSDHQLRDIGLRRDQIDQTAINSQHEAMRYSS